MVVNAFDILFVATAVLTNVIVSAIYIFTRKNAMMKVRKLGISFILLGLPFIVVLIGYIFVDHEFWVYLTISYIIVFIFIQFILDIILKSNFRERKIPHTLYIFFFYIYQACLIVLSFSINLVTGYIVSSSFWILLACLIYLILGRVKAKKIDSDN